MDSFVYGPAGSRLCRARLGTAGNPSLPFGPAGSGDAVVSVLLAVYAYGRRREVVELKTLLQDFAGRNVGCSSSGEQLDWSIEIIARSQRSFKELIDSFEDAA